MKIISLCPWTYSLKSKYIISCLFPIHKGFRQVLSLVHYKFYMTNPSLSSIKYFRLMENMTTASLCSWASSCITQISLQLKPLLFTNPNLLKPSPWARFVRNIRKTQAERLMSNLSFDCQKPSLWLHEMVYSPR